MFLALGMPVPKSSLKGERKHILIYLQANYNVSKKDIFVVLLIHADLVGVCNHSICPESPETIMLLPNIKKKTVSGMLLNHLSEGGRGGPITLHHNTSCHNVGGDIDGTNKL